MQCRFSKARIIDTFFSGLTKSHDLRVAHSPRSTLIHWERAGVLRDEKAASRQKMLFL